MLIAYQSLKFDELKELIKVQGILVLTVKPKKDGKQEHKRICILDQSDYQIIFLLF
jgi:hypothetical protein